MASTSSKTSAKLLPCENAQIHLELTDKKLPLSLGIEIPGGRVQRVLERGIRIPHHHTELYSTADAYQMAAEFHIVMGERPLACDNLDVARIRVRNVKWSSAGVPKIEIAFDVDANGVLTLSAVNKDKKHTELWAHISLPSISAEDVKAALADAEASREQDAQHEKNIEQMLSGYYLLDQAYERYSIAKRRMGPLKKRAYKTVRKRLQKALEVMPPEATEASMAELSEALDAFRVAYQELEEDQRAVMSWWEKK